MKYLRRMMWSLVLVATVLFSKAFVQTIQASEVLSYTQTASLSKDNQVVTNGTYSRLVKDVDAMPRATAHVG